MTVGPWTAGIVLVAALVWAEAWGFGMARIVAKTMASSMFVLQGYLSLGGVNDGVGAALMVALLASWVGDVCLLARSRLWLFVGILSFLGAHVAYAVVFVALGPSPAVAVVGTVVAAGAGIGIVGWMGDRVGPLRQVAALYALGIAVMVGLAAGVAASGGAGMVVALGAVAFWVSDGFVARERFVSRSFTNKAIGLPLYYGAQFVLARSIPALLAFGKP